MTIIGTIKHALETYKGGAPRNAVAFLREAADKIEAETNAAEQADDDADGWTDHMRASVEDYDQYGDDA